MTRNRNGCAIPSNLSRRQAGQFVIEAALAALGMRPVELSRLTGHAPATISRYRAGRGVPTKAFLLDLLDKAPNAGFTFDQIASRLGHGWSGSKDPSRYKRFADYFADVRVLERRNRAQFAIKLGITIDDVRDLEHGVLPDETLIKRFARTFLRPDHSYKHVINAFPSLRPNELARLLRDRCLEFQHLPKADPVRRKMENDIIEECVPMARRIAKSVAGRYRRSDLAEDILGLGLVLAVRDHDPRRGYLPGFLWVRIKGVARGILWSGMQTGVTKALRNHGLMVREAEDFLLQDFGRHPTEAEIAQHLDVKVEVVREVNQALLASNTLLTDDFELLLQDVVGMSVATRLWAENDDVLVARFRQLSPSEQELLFLFYYDQFPPPEIARLTGLPEPDISTDIKWAVAKLTNG